MIRSLSPRPGPVGAQGTSTTAQGPPPANSPPAQASGKKAMEVNLRVLRQGSRGPEVQKLQRQLNARLTPSPKLAVDGVFGPVTHQTVLQYQRGVSIVADGTVGKQTWYYLLKGDQATVLQPAIPRTQLGVAAAPSSTVPALPARPALPAPAAGVWEWPLEDKFAEALRRTAPKLPGSMRHEFEALLNPTTLGILVGTLVVWAGSHAFGVGEIIDVVLLVGGLLFLGMAIFDVARELGDFLTLTSTATNEQDLDEAASHLARAIAIIGVAAFMALIAKVAKGRGQGSKGGAPEAPAEPPPAQTPRAPKTTSPEPPPEPPAAKPAAPTKSPTELQLDEIYAKAPAAKTEIDAMADGIAQQTGGRVAKAPLKGRARATEKAINDYGGDASKVKDIARNTVVVEQSQYNKAVALLKQQEAQVKEISAASDPMGYSGTNAVVKTKAGIPAEIQVNTPEMIYAKESPA
ncbi:MAG TPA: peptidoglycan-binding protein, partial [Blastocatellia bacterium]|nr:peptidoglycan-binding protein [Blastocatellia bacterium]